MSMRRYVLLVLLCGVAVIATLFGVMRAMDPLYYYGAIDRPGINAVRYGAVDFPDTAKIYSVQWYKPRAVIMGSSRAQIGLDPSHKAFPHQPVYSLAYPGASMRRTLALFEHAVATGEIKQIVLAVDFFTFRVGGGGDDEFQRLAAMPDGSAPDRLKHWRARALDFWRASFSSASIKMAASDLTTNSQFLDFRAMRWIMRRDGHNELVNAHNFDYGPMFGAVEASYAKDYTTGEFCLSSRAGDSSLGDLRLLVSRARDLGIDLRIMISPEHASLAEVLDRTGLWRSWEVWKREIVRIAEEDGRSTPVYDFSGYNTVTTEPVPINAADVQMENYWDPSHYKRHIGNRALDIVLRDTPPSEPTFGKRLTLQNVDRHLESIRQDQASWRAQNPQQVARVKADQIGKRPVRNCRNGPDVN